MKKKIIISIILLLIISLIIGTIIFINSKQLSVKIENNPKVLINTETYNIDYIKDIKNGTLVTKKNKIDTSKLGKQKITITIKDYFKNNKEYKYEITIYDDIAPVISFEKELTTEEGKEIDLYKNVSATDNSKEIIAVKVEGDYDFDKVGTYNLKYIAKDSSNNIKEEPFVLNVTAKKTNISSTPKTDTTFTTSKGFTGKIVNGITYIDGVLIVNKTYPLPSTYGSGLTKTTQDAFDKMAAAATLEGLNIYLSSGFRSYSTQNRIYNNYVKRDGKEKADTYSARPGHSEHQSGLAFDVNQINDTFNNSKEAIWLSNNCYKYGFILRYPKDKSNETGYKYESWHFRFVGVDLATKLYNNGNWITLEDYYGITSTYN